MADMLRLCNSETITRNDHYFICITQYHGRIAEADLFVIPTRCRCRSACSIVAAEGTQQNIFQAPVHGLTHQYGKQCSGSTYQDTTCQHYLVIIKETTECRGHTRE